MKNLLTKICSTLLLFIVTGLFTVATAQCSTASAPSFSSSCSAEYFTTIGASGTTVVSTISLAGGSCSGTYTDDYASQGVTVTAGNTVNINITRYTTTYTAYLTVYVDLNNDGTYNPSTELVGSSITMPSSLLTTTYSFVVPTTGIVTGTHLHMRVFLSELRSGATYAPPCDGTYGQAFDYYLQANCPPTTTFLSVTPPSASVCAGGPGALLTASGAPSGTSYSWSPAAGLSTTTGTTVTATPTATTVYTVTGTATTGCPPGPATVTVSVNPVPTATVTVAGALTFCTGDSAVFTTTAGTGNTYQWYNGSSAITGATNSTYKATATGSYTVKVTAPGGCSATSTAFVVMVHTLVAVSITHTTPNAFCAGDSVKLTATSGTGYNYQWLQAGATIAGATSSTYTANASGYYSCNIVIPGACMESTGKDTVVVHPIPVPVVTFDGKTFHTPNYYRTYQWYENAIVIPGATHDSVIAHTNGNFTVKVTDTNGCSGTSLVFNLTKLATQNVNTTGTISIYPNPANDVIYVESQVAVNVVISGIDGKLLLEKKNAISADISALPGGLYLVTLYDESGHRLLVQKLIKN